MDNFLLESVDNFDRNGWTTSNGIGGQLRPENAPKKAAIARYLRILAGWKLGAEQWTKLGDLAVLRVTRRFPMPGELHEIAVELMEEEELRANSERLASMRHEWEGRSEGMDDALSGGLP